MMTTDQTTTPPVTTLPPVTLRDRWRTSLHEGGHLVAFLAACDDAEVVVTSFVSTDGGGGSLLPKKQIHRDDFALSLAAGEIAAESFAAEPVPPLQEPFAPEVNAGPVESSPDELVRVPLPDEELGPDDATLIARWCIERHSREPAKWAERYAVAMNAARFAVYENKRAILFVAREIFATGVAVYSRNTLREGMKNAEATVCSDQVQSLPR